jgi:hypothetical protein
MTNVVEFSDTCDVKIQALFRKWVELSHTLDAIAEINRQNDDDGDGEFDAVIDKRCDIETQIFAIPGGPLGLGVKVFLRCHDERHFGQRIGAPGWHYGPPGWYESVLRDAMALAPDIMDAGELP